MPDGMIAYAVLSMLMGLPAYLTGWLLLRIAGRNVESLPRWWSRTVHASLGKAKRQAFLKYELEGQEVLTAECAFQVGCLFWVSLLILLPLGIWLAYSLTATPAGWTTYRASAPA